jgi:hypothetical protein
MLLLFLLFSATVGHAVGNTNGNRTKRWACPNTCTSCTNGGYINYNSRGVSQEISGRLSSHQCLWFTQPDNGWFDISLAQDNVQNCPLCAGFNIYPYGAGGSYYCESGSVFSLWCSPDNQNLAFVVECANNWSGCNYGFLFYNFSDGSRKHSLSPKGKHADSFCSIYNCNSKVAVPERSPGTNDPMHTTGTKHPFVPTIDLLPSCNGCYVNSGGSSYACCKNMRIVNNQCTCNNNGTPCTKCIPEKEQTK